MTCPDLRYIFSIVSQYCANLNFIYVAMVVQILWYIHSLLYYGPSYTQNQPRFVRYTNADWSDAIDRQQSIGGLLFLL